jgi:hypothetical protein
MSSPKTRSEAKIFLATLMSALPNGSSQVARMTEAGKFITALDGRRMVTILWPAYVGSATRLSDGVDPEPFAYVAFEEYKTSYPSCLQLATLSRKETAPTVITPFNLLEEMTKKGYGYSTVNAAEVEAPKKVLGSEVFPTEGECLRFARVAGSSGGGIHYAPIRGGFPSTNFLNVDGMTFAAFDAALVPLCAIFGAFISYKGGMSKSSFSRDTSLAFMNLGAVMDPDNLESFGNAVNQMFDFAPKDPKVVLHGDAVSHALYIAIREQRKNPSFTIDNWYTFTTLFNNVFRIKEPGKPTRGILTYNPTVSETGKTGQKFTFKFVPPSAPSAVKGVVYNYKQKTASAEQAWTALGLARNIRGHNRGVKGKYSRSGYLPVVIEPALADAVYCYQDYEPFIRNAIYLALPNEKASTVAMQFIKALVIMGFTGTVYLPPVNLSDLEFHDKERKTVWSKRRYPGASFVVQSVSATFLLMKKCAVTGEVPPDDLIVFDLIKKNSDTLTDALKYANHYSPELKARVQELNAYGYPFVTKAFACTGFNDLINELGLGATSSCLVHNLVVLVHSLELKPKGEFYDLSKKSELAEYFALSIMFNYQRTMSLFSMTRPVPLVRKLGYRYPRIKLQTLGKVGIVDQNSVAIDGEGYLETVSDILEDMDGRSVSELAQLMSNDRVRERFERAIEQSVGSSSTVSVKEKEKEVDSDVLNTIHIDEDEEI